MRKLGILILLTLYLIYLSAGVSIGVTPGYVNYGEVEPGESINIEFYVTTSDIDQEFEVEPEYEKSLKYALGENAVIDMRNVSEQNIESWIEPEQETYNIDPNTSETYQLPDGTSVEAEGEISFTVYVPTNTEPGYRIGTIQLNPNFQNEREETSARLVTQTVPGFAFRVPGSVDRSIELADTRAVRVAEDRVQIIKQLRNTGTVTTTLTGGQTDILNERGQTVGTINVKSATLAPGEFAEIDALWAEDDLEGGQYSLEGQGDYKTGEMYISGDFAITDTISERQSIDEPSGGTGEAEDEVPVILILIISLLLGTVLYLLDAEITWTIILTGGMTVSLFIILGSVPVYFFLIPIISIGVMLYI
jgi:hypothetical protein